MSKVHEHFEHFDQFQNPPTLPAQNLRILVKPEIRLKSIWNIQFTLAREFLRVYPISKIVFVPDSKKLGGKQVNGMKFFLVLKVESKLIKPTKEVEITEVAQVVTDDVVLRVEQGKANLNVKFTKRPRKAFQRHSDVMIMRVELYRGTEMIAMDRQELVFRGGTGSIHSAGEMKKREKMKMMKVMQQNQMSHSYPPIQSPVAQMMNQYAYPVPVQGNVFPSLYQPLAGSGVGYLNAATSVHNELPKQLPTLPMPGDRPIQTQMGGLNNNIQNFQTEIKDEDFSLNMDSMDNMFNEFHTGFLGNPSDYYLPGADLLSDSYSLSEIKEEPMEPKIIDPNEIQNIQFEIRSQDSIDHTSLTGTTAGTFMNKPFTINFEAILKNGEIEGSFSGSFL